MPTEGAQRERQQIRDALEAIKTTSKVLRHGMRNRLATIVLLNDVDTPDAKRRIVDEVRKINEMISVENNLLSCPLKLDCPVLTFGVNPGKELEEKINNLEHTDSPASGQVEGEK